MKKPKPDWGQIRINALIILGLLLHLSGGLYAMSEKGPDGLRFGLSFLAIILGTLLVTHFNEQIDNPLMGEEKRVALADERNAAIRDRAKAKAFDFSTRLILTYVVLFSYFDGRLYHVTILASIYILSMGLEWLYRKKYEAEM